MTPASCLNCRRPLPDEHPLDTACLACQREATEDLAFWRAVVAPVAAWKVYGWDGQRSASVELDRDRTLVLTSEHVRLIQSSKLAAAARILELEALLANVAEHLPYHERGHPDWTPLSDLGREVRATLRGETDAE
jgi:hypothetical protein